MRRWFLLALTAALLTAVVVTAVAAAGGVGGPTGLVDRGVQALGADTGDDSAPGREEDAWRYCGEGAFRAGPALDAVEDPEARAEAEALRERHRAEMREWWEKYGDAPRGEAAQEELRGLREQHREEFRAMLEGYGVELPEGARLGEGGRARGMFGVGEDGVCGQGRGGMMGDASASW
jgi:PAS domain-containing protein